MNAPAITVLMPLHNASRHLDEAVDSILGQTWRDFELLVVDDGSTDDGPQKLAARAANDPRIRIERLPRNLGIVGALNHGLTLARGALIARMDADDIAEPERLARQAAFLEIRPHIGVVGTDFTPFGEAPDASWMRYTEPEDLRIALLFESPLCHPTVMMRRSVLEGTEQPYPGDHPHAEDYALWLRLSARTQLANINERLLRYRTHAGQISRTKSEAQCRSIDLLIGEQLHALGLPSDKQALRTHHMLGLGFNPRPGLESTLRSWAQTLINANARARIYPPDALARQLNERIQASLARHRKALSAMPLLPRAHWIISAWLRSRRTSDVA